MNGVNRFIAAITILSVAFNIFFFYKFIIPRSLLSNPSDDPNRYPYLSPRIFAENKNDAFIGFMPLRQEVRKYIEQNGPNNIGFYFEYLPSGSSIGINEKEELPLASLLKLPIVIGIYELVERGNLSFDTVLTLEEKHIDKAFGNFWKKGTGTKLTVGEAVNLTLIESDNTTAQLLYSLLPSKEKADLYEDLDLFIQKDLDDYHYVIGTPKSYASILRALYLSTILKKEHSSEILDILTKTSFTDKIPAGVPKQVMVAHKIGEYKRSDTDSFVYSDCGIIYVPKRPYVLCLMIQGSENEAIKHISFLSKMVYGYISKINIIDTEDGF